MKDWPISRIMSTPVLTVAPDAPIATATALLEEHGVHHLLVVERDRMAGILSSSDLLKLALLLSPDHRADAADADDPLGLRVRDLMQTRVAVVRENTRLEDVARALSLGGFHAVPVLALDDTPVGIVTSSDLVALLIDEIGKPDGGASREDDAPAELRLAAMPRLLEVLQAADVYLHSGQSDQQHARLVRAVSRARELTTGRENPLGL